MVWWPFRRRRLPDWAPDKAERRAWTVAHRHAAWQKQAEGAYYRRRTDPDALGLGVEACRQQIALAPEALAALRTMHEKRRERVRRAGPTGGGRDIGPFRPPAHHGFRQLAIVREKEGDVAGALRLCEEARRQGWAGDWDRRIARLEKKAGKV